MGSLRSRCPPGEAPPQREGSGYCISKIIDHFGQMFSRTPCPKNENEARVTRQLVNSIECEPLKQGENEEPTVTVYRDIEEPPFKPTQCSPWSNKGIIVALVVTFLSLGINYVMWLTNAYDNAVLKLVSIRDDIDTVFEMWRMPPTKAHFSVYFFNYTNTVETIAGAEFPKVQEVGPYVFREQMERIHVKFNDNDTVSFQEQRTISFAPELSATPLNATIWSPNVVLIVALTTLKDNIHFIEQYFLDSLSGPGGGKVFLNLTIDQALWGYQDDLVNKLAAFKGDKPEFGLLAKRRGVHHDIITMKTGGEDLTKVGIITRWNGKDKIGAWGNTTCDEIEGSDGTQFPAKFVREHKNLHIYNHPMCRRLSLLFNKTTLSKDGFPVQQYNVDEEMFNFNKEENRCFKMGGHLPNGVTNTSPCHMGAPLYASFPHFWKGSEEIKQHISGLTPDPEKHMSYFHVHKDLGISLRAKTRFQLNILLEKFNYMTFSKNLKAEKIILPIGWIDYDSGDLPPHFVDSVYHLTYTVKVVKEVLKWTFLFVFIIAVAVLYYLRAVKVKKQALI